jgi:hypothetical protein
MPLNVNRSRIVIEAQRWADNSDLVPATFGGKTRHFFRGKTRELFLTPSPQNLSHQTRRS